MQVFKGQVHLFCYTFTSVSQVKPSPILLHKDFEKCRCIFIAVGYYVLLSKKFYLQLVGGCELYNYLKIHYCCNCCLHVGQRHGDLRLVGPNKYEGRVEVYFSAETGFIPICNSLLFHSQEADVICRQLTFVGAETFGKVSELGLVEKNESLFINCCWFRVQN